MLDIKALVVTNDTSKCSKIEKILKQNIKEIHNFELDNEALIAMNLFVFDVIIVYAKASLILQKDFFANNLQEYKKHIPIITLIDEKDAKYIKSISNLPGIDFCLAFDFSKGILIELLQDCILTAIELKN